MNKALIDIVARHTGLDPEKITPDTELYRYCYDLDLMEILMEAEGEFGVSIPDDALDGINTVGDILRYINTKG
ncbi:MAG: acyl carrier protein [Solobacterium sp.]|nr:acyl carrier protein [Solobacterium sp.]